MIVKVKADYIPSILESGKTFDNPRAIANIFNSFFVNVGKNTDKVIVQPLFRWAIFLIQCSSPHSPKNSENKPLKI